MTWRAIALVSLLYAVCLFADTLHHDEFESGVVGMPSSPEYLVRCEGLEFGREETVATIRLFDEGSFPQFAAYRQASARRPAPYIYVPAAYGTAAGWLRFVGFEELPDLVLNPKPNNDIHEAVLKIAFQPVSTVRNDPQNIDLVYLGFPGVRPFAVRRTSPLSQSQSALVALQNSVIGAVSPHMARTGIFLALLAIGWILGDAYLKRDMLLYRWKLKQLGKGIRVAKGKDRHATAEEAQVLAPAKWNEQLIATQIRNLQHRPAMLAVFTHALKDRFILNQDEKTAKVRIAYLKSKLEELKLSKELQGELDDLQFREADLEIRQMEQDLKKADLEHQVKMRAALKEAEHKRDLLRIKAEAAQLEKQIRDTKPTNPTPDDTAQIQDLRERIQRHKERRAYIRETVTDQDERRREENHCDDKIAQLEEELADLL